MDWTKFDGTFLRDAIAQDGISEIKVIPPWRATWEQPAEGAEPGYLHRPEFYAERNIEHNGVQSQALGTQYATHDAGIIQGPFAAPAGSEIGFSLAGQMITSPPAGGGGTMWAAIVPCTLEGNPEWGQAQLSAKIQQAYNQWFWLDADWVSDGRDFILLGHDSWRWRARSCVTLFGEAHLIVSPPAAPGPNLPETGEYDLLIGDQVLRVALRRHS